MSGNKQTSSIEAESTTDIDFIFEDGAAYPSVTDDGEYVAYVNQETHTITAREVETGETVESIEIENGSGEGKIFAGTAFSPDSTHFSVVVRKDDGYWWLLLYNTEVIDNWNLEQDFTSDSEYKGTTAFSRPEGDRVTYSDFNALYVFDVDTWEDDIEGPYHNSLDHDFSADYFAQTEDDGVLVHDAANISEELTQFTDAKQGGISFSADGQYLAYVADNATVIVRETGGDWPEKASLSLDTSDAEVIDVQFFGTASEQKLASVVPEAGAVYVCDTDEWNCNEVATLDVTDIPDRSLAAARDDGSLVVATEQPVEIVGYPDPGLVNDEVTFEAAADVVTVTDYTWEFDPGDDGATATGKEVGYTYNEPGTYKVQLIATTEDNGKFTDTVTVDINPVIAEFTVESENLAPGPEIVFDASDSESDNPVDRYEWFFSGDDEPDAKGERVTHVFEEVGEFEVTLAVTDEEGNTDTVSKLLSVERELWRVGADDWVQSSPTVVDGTVYVGSNDGSVYALDALTGEQHWEFETDGEVHSSPNVVDGTVYVGSSDNHIYALEADTEWDGGSAAQGDYEWRFNTGGEVRSSPTVLDGMVYAASDAGYLYALAANPAPEQDGVTVEDAVWEFELTPPDRGSAVVQNGHVYALDETENRLVVLNVEDGSEEWSFEPEDGSVIHSPTVADDTVYVAAGRYLYAVAAEQEGGTVETYEWRFEMEATVETVPTVEAGLVYAGTDSYMYAIDVNGGGGSHTEEDEEWRFEPDSDVGSSPTVAGDVVYFGEDSSAGSDVYALDAMDGTVVWQSESSVFPFWSAPTVVDGVVYAGSLDDIVHALGAGSHTSSEDSRVNLGTLGHTDTWADRAKPDPLTLTAEGDVISDPETEVWNLSLSGTQVDRIIIDRAWLKWEVEDVTATEGAVPSYPPEVEGDSTLTLEWSDTQSEVSLDVALAPPGDIYVGGEYRLQVIAERGSETVNTEIMVEIREEM